MDRSQIFYQYLQNYFTILGGSLKKMAKKMIPKVPINKKVYTSASIRN
jgi:hypothetical protein